VKHPKANRVKNEVTARAVKPSKNFAAIHGGARAGFLDHRKVADEVDDSSGGVPCLGRRRLG